jgi:uncharacterized protein YcbX
LLPGRAKQGAEPANPISLRPRRQRRIQVIRPGLSHDRLVVVVDGDQNTRDLPSRRVA